jgi:hypothetical protein
MPSLFKSKPVPPGPEAVFRRASILKIQAMVALTTPPPDVLKGLMDSWSQADQRGFMDRMSAVSRELEQLLRKSGAWSDATDAERMVVRSRPGELQGQAHMNAAWAAESAACMIWALGYLDAMPPYDTEVGHELLGRLPDGDGPIPRLRLRSAEEIARARDDAESWNWRSRTRQLQEAGRVGGKVAGDYTIEDVIRLTAGKAAEAGMFPAPIGDDFPIFGKPYRAASTDEWRQATSIAMERHKAYNWLCGFAPGNQWDRTPTDT